MIVGAGPTGLALALQLAQRDLPVTLVEARPTAAGLFRGEALMPSGMEALEQLGLLPLEPAVQPLPLQGWSFWLERRPLFRADEPMGSTYPCTLVDPDSLLRAWGERLVRLPAAQLISGIGVTELTGADRAAGEGRIQGIRLADGRHLEADLVIGCDGRASALRRSAGLEPAATGRPIDVLWFRIGGPAGQALAQRLEGRFHTVIGAQGALALYASARGGVQLGWPLQRGQSLKRSLQQWLGLWQQLCPPALAEALLAVPEQAIEGPQRLPVRVALATPWWRPGLLLLGDAAHPMSPLRAQGTAMALRDVQEATALLPDALAHTAGPERHAAIDRALARLEERRRPEIERMQALQQREWQRAERLAEHPALRQLLAALAPGLAPLLAALWCHSQQTLRQGLIDPTPLRPVTAVMMEPTDAA